MRYELWDIEAHFFLGRFASEDEALRFVRVVLDREGDAYADNLELVIGENGVRNLSGATLADSAHALDQEGKAQEQRRSAHAGARSAG